MAWLEQRPSGQFHVAFRFGDLRCKKSLRTLDPKIAEARLHRLEDNIRLVESGHLVIPDDADVASFLLSDGKMNGRVKRPAVRFLSELVDQYINGMIEGSVEENTFCTLKIHLNHFIRIFGKRFSSRDMDFQSVQRYVNKRANEPGRAGRKVSPTTIKKELTTLTTVRNWAHELGHVAGPLRKRGLRFPKTQEKPPFQTWDEIERKIRLGNLSDCEQAELWDSLFLTLAEIDELLGFVEKTAAHPVILPMFAFVAHTGARRSEMLRSQLPDIDLDTGIVTIREKKRVKGKLTTRTVPVSPYLDKVLRQWLAEHLGGQHTFCLGLHLSRSTKHRPDHQPLTADEARDHFETTLRRSKWEKLRGWHVFRHSFCSNCAAAGIDQRIINAWVGHQTEEMVRRYRHLIPNQQQDAIRKVFSQSA